MAVIVPWPVMVTLASGVPAPSYVEVITRVPRLGAGNTVAVIVTVFVVEVSVELTPIGPRSRRVAARCDRSG